MPIGDHIVAVKLEAYNMFANKMASSFLVMATLVCFQGFFVHVAQAQTLPAHNNDDFIQFSPVLPAQGFAVQDTGRITNSAYPAGYYPYDVATSPEANWTITAWSNAPGEAYFLPFTSQQQSDGLLWTSSSSPTASQSMDISLQQNAEGVITSETLQQNGISNVNGCLSDGSPLEDDLFVAGSLKDLNPYYPSAYLRDASNSTPNPTLDKVTALTIRGSVELLNASPSVAPGRCALNQSAMIYSLVFNNLINHQTFFYQLDINYFCYPGTNPEINAWCQAVVPQTNYFFTGQNNEWGVDDPISKYFNPETNTLYALLQVPGKMDLNLNVLPRIALIITDARYGMDNDLSHWQWSGFYYGQHTWGDSTLESRWNSTNFSPTISYTIPCGSTPSGSTFTQQISQTIVSAAASVTQCPYGGTQTMSFTTNQTYLCTNGNLTAQGSPTTTTVASGNPTCNAPASCGSTPSGSTVTQQVSQTTGTATASAVQCPYGGTQPTTTTVTQIQLCTNGNLTAQETPVSTTTNSGSPSCNAVSSSSITVSGAGQIPLQNYASVNGMQADHTGLSYDLGWIQSGGTVQYDLDVTQPGAYTLKVLYASPNGGTGINISVNQAPVGSVNFGSTGSWAIYKNSAPLVVNLPAGKTTLVLEAKHPKISIGSLSGFNIGKLILTPVTHSTRVEY